MAGIGYLLGILTISIIFVLNFGQEVKLGAIAKEKIEECQQELPRTEHCTIIAVPQKDVEE